MPIHIAKQRPLLCWTCNKPPVCEASGKSMLQHSLAKLQPGLWALSCLLLSASWVLQALVKGSEEHSFCAQEGGLMTE